MKVRSKSISTGIKDGATGATVISAEVMVGTKRFFKKLERWPHMQPSSDNKRQSRTMTGTELVNIFHYFQPPPYFAVLGYVEHTNKECLKTEACDSDVSDRGFGSVPYFR